MNTAKQRVAALLEHLQDSCALEEIIFYLETLARWDRNGSHELLECRTVSEAEVFDLTRSEEWDRACVADAERQMTDIKSGIDETIPADIVLAEARARLSK